MIATYSEPGDLVLDPLCSDGSCLLEAIRQGRNALGVVGDNQLAGTNVLARIARARARGARGHAAALLGDPAELPQLLARQASGFLRRHRRSPTLTAHPCGSGDLILVLRVEPPFGRRGSSSCSRRSRRSLSDEALCGAAAGVLRPGGFLVLAENIESDGGLPDVRMRTVRLCQELGLQYWQHVVALLVPLRDGQLGPQHRYTASCTDTSDIAASHADVLVFCKPSPTSATPRTAVEAA